MSLNFGKSVNFIPGWSTGFGLVAGAVIDALRPLDYGKSADEIVNENKAMIHDFYKGNNSIYDLKLKRSLLD